MLPSYGAYKLTAAIFQFFWTRFDEITAFWIRGGRRPLCVVAADEVIPYSCGLFMHMRG